MTIPEFFSATPAAIISAIIVYVLRKKPADLYVPGIIPFVKNACLFIVAAVTFYILIRLLFFGNSGIVPASGLTMGLLLLYFSCIFLATEFFYLRNCYKEAITRGEILRSLVTTAELETLKGQLDPHFVFNSLNTLSYLVKSENASSRIYIEKLSLVYRYILSDKGRNLISLSKEIEFLNNYFHLMKIRHEDALQLNIRIINIDPDEYHIPKMALQQLFENSIKHNTFTNADPLVVNIEIGETGILIQNKLCPKYTGSENTGIGLKNLSERCSLLIEKPIQVNQTPDLFVVRVPIKKV